jgi:hypothetical protein
MTSLSSLGVESRAMTVQIPGLPQKTARDHAGIVEAIASRRPEVAREMMAKHLANVAAAAAEAAKAKEVTKAVTPRGEYPDSPRRGGHGHHQTPKSQRVSPQKAPPDSRADPGDTVDVV